MTTLPILFSQTDSLHIKYRYILTKRKNLSSVKYDGETEVKERFTRFTEENPVNKCLGEPIYC
jgi:hypothetical protein